MSCNYEQNYLEQYWPPRPNNPDTWEDNLDLLQAYFLAAERILDEVGYRIDALDISTGPCLAPLMAIEQCLASIRTSDYTEYNRAQIARSNIEYWTEYAQALETMFPGRADAHRILERADTLRKMHVPLDVDLRRRPVFLPDVIAQGYADLLTMHFVVDSICDTTSECFEMFDNALSFVRPMGWLLLSVLVDSSWWMLGDSRQPSPRLAEADINNFLEQRGYRILMCTRTPNRDLRIHDGALAVILAKSSSAPCQTMTCAT
jgi:hypothetical protein